jgi:effector-binding domain-containing protein
MLGIAGPPLSTENRDVAFQARPHCGCLGVRSGRQPRFAQNLPAPPAERQRANAAGTCNRRPRLAVAVAARRCPGEQVTLPERTIIYMKGHSNGIALYDTLVDASQIVARISRQTGRQAGRPGHYGLHPDRRHRIHSSAALPIAQVPDPPKGDIAVGPAPSGKALKFVHRGSYDAMDSTYEAITNYLDDKQLEAKDLFIEEYTTDPVKTDPDKLVVNVYVPVK